eukprot:757379-Hanusia_phi.AAC.16
MGDATADADATRAMPTTSATMRPPTAFLCLQGKGGDVAAKFLAMQVLWSWRQTCSRAAMGMTFRHVQGRRAMHKLAIRELTSIENIAVIGGGSIGSLLSGRIAATSRMRDRVWMLTSSSEHASVRTCMRFPTDGVSLASQAIKAVRGIVVKEEGTVGKNTMMGQVRVAESLSEVEDLKKESLALYGFGKASLVFIAVKQAGLRKAAEQAARVLAGSHGSLCIAVMNGVGHMEVIHKALR